MSDEPNDSEFVEINLMPEPAPEGGETAKPEGDEAPAGEGEEKPEGEAKPEGEDGEGEGDGEGDDAEALRDDKGRYKNRSEARIAELTRARRTAERERDEAIARLNGARDPAKAASPKPTPDDFEDYGEYVEALTDWKADQRETARAGTDAERAAERASTVRNEQWSAKIDQTAATLPDYNEVVGKSDIPIANHVADALMDADRGPELAYHLAKNPDVATRLNEMSPMRAAVELGKIEASLEKAAPPLPPPAKKPSNAPAPITPVKSGSTTAKDPAKMDMAEYKAWRAEQLK